ncbi:unnamed protein product, partial [Callosobruchus maculatus]
RQFGVTFKDTAGVILLQKTYSRQKPRSGLELLTWLLPMPLDVEWTAAGEGPLAAALAAQYGGTGGRPLAAPWPPTPAATAAAAPDGTGSNDGRIWDDDWADWDWWCFSFTFLPMELNDSPFVLVLILSFSHAVPGGLVDVVVGVHADLVRDAPQTLEGATHRPRLLDALEAASLALHVRRRGHREAERGRRTVIVDISAAQVGQDDDLCFTEPYAVGTRNDRAGIKSLTRTPAICTLNMYFYQLDRKKPKMQASEAEKQKDAAVQTENDYLGYKDVSLQTYTFTTAAVNLSPSQVIHVAWVKVDPGMP